MEGNEGAPEYLTKADFARYIDRTPAMISKYLKQGRLVVTTDGRVDVRATLERLRLSLDPSRGGRGGKSHGMDRLQELTDASAPPVDSYPADPQFRDAADTIRANLMTNLDLALEAIPARDARVVREEFRRWLVDGTAGLGQVLQQHVERLKAGTVQ